MIINRELTQQIRIERHREGDAPIVFEFVKPDQSPYTLTGGYAFHLGGRVLTGAVAGHLLTFTLSAADRAALPQSVYAFEIERTASGDTTVPFKGVFSWAVLAGDQAAFAVPRIRVTVGSESVTAGVSVLEGPSNYQIAVNNGFVGTEQEWLASLADGGGGGAIMAKAIYDTDDDGIVDNAARIEGLSINQISLNGGYF